jgi:hypothetical protein
MAVSVTLHATGVSLAVLRFPTSIGIRLGDDVATTSVLFQGTLQLP